jgi:hypothetical protein
MVTTVTGLSQIALVTAGKDRRDKDVTLCSEWFSDFFFFVRLVYARPPVCCSSWQEPQRGKLC